jgi:ribosomal protein L23
MKSKANSKEVKEAFEEIYNVLDTFKGTKKDNITVF